MGFPLFLEHTHPESRTQEECRYLLQGHRTFMLLLPRFVYRDRNSLRVGDLNEITYGYTIEIARVACLDRRCSPCRTLQCDCASALVDASDGGDDGRHPCPGPGGFLAELGTSRFLSYGGTRRGCARFLHFVGEGLVEGRSHLIAYLDLR